MVERVRPGGLAGRALLALLALAMVSDAAQAQLQWKSQDEKLTFKIGLLGQLQAESIDVAGTDDAAQNLFFRRMRLLMSFTLGERLTIFMDTDSPNLGKANNAGVKDAGDIFIQDFVASYKFGKSFYLDAGLILPALSYNHNQSAASHLATDYGPYTFVESGPMGARVGRDYGIRGRGYAAENHFEYIFGMLQGARGTNASNDFRYFGRVMYQWFTPQVGLFYRGTSFGKTKTISVGASFDKQEDYQSYSGDVFVDLPLANKNGLTLKAELLHFDGDTFLATVPKQDDLLIEGGFFIASAKVMPFVQYANQNFDAANRIDEKKTSAGLAFVINGHNNNVKLSYGRISPSRGEDRDQWLVQWQIFQF